MYYLRKRFQNIDFAKTNYALFIEKNNCPSYKYLFAKKESFIRLWMLFKENHNTRWVMSSKRRTVPIMLFFLESALISWSCPYNSITQSLMATFHLTSILSFLDSSVIQLLWCYISAVTIRFWNAEWNLGKFKGD